MAQLQSQRTVARDLLRNKIHSERKETMTHTTDQSRVNSALNSTLRVDEADFDELEADFDEGVVLSEGEYDDVEAFEGDDEDEEFYEDDEPEVDDEDEGDDEDDEDDEDEDEEAFTNELDSLLESDEGDDEDDDDSSLVDDILASAHAAVQDELFTDTDDISTDDFLGAQSLGEMIGLSETVNHVTTTIDTSVLITIDLSEPTLFDEFSPKQLVAVSVDSLDEPVNVYMPLHRKRNGVSVAALNDLLDYSSVIGETGLTILTTPEQSTETVNYLEEGIRRAASTLVSESLGSEDGADIPLLISDAKLSEAEDSMDEDDEDSEEEVDYETERGHSIVLDDLLRATTFVSVQGDLETDAVVSSSVVTHIAMRFPAITHNVNVEKGNSCEILARIKRVIEKFAEKRPNVKVRLGYTLNSTFAIASPLGREISNHLLEVEGLTPYNYNDVCFGDTPLNAGAYYSPSAGVHLGRQVFTYGGDVIYVADIEPSLDEEIEETEE